MNGRAWVEAYRQALPATLRLHEADSRYSEPATRAARNGWTPEALAEHVAGIVARRSNINAPAMFALRVMWDTADTTPGVALPAPRAAAADDWRANLPDGKCPHDGGLALDLDPIQCKRCRFEAGDPTIVRRSGKRCPVCSGPLEACEERLNDPTPPEFIPARRQLLADLDRQHVTDPDDREAAMVALIWQQRHGLGAIV